MTATYLQTRLSVVSATDNFCAIVYVAHNYVVIMTYLRIFLKAKTRENVIIYSRLARKNCFYKAEKGFRANA
jgi:hypothetical protein